MREIKVRDKEGNIYSSSLDATMCITAIHFSTTYTQFEVQEEYIDDEGNVKYKHKDVIVPVEGKNDLEAAIDFIAVSHDEIGEIVV